jgi:hypothetical protein
MKHKKTYYRPKRWFTSFGPCCGCCGCLLAVLAPRFHPTSSCSWQWLGALWWWWSRLWSFEVSWVNQQGHMTTHLTRSDTRAYPWHHGNGYSVARVWQTQTPTYTHAYPWHIIMGLPIPVSCLRFNCILTMTDQLNTNIQIIVTWTNITSVWRSGSVQFLSILDLNQNQNWFYSIHGLMETKPNCIKPVSCGLVQFNYRLQLVFAKLVVNQPKVSWNWHCIHYIHSNTILTR